MNDTTETAENDVHAKVGKVPWSSTTKKGREPSAFRPRKMRERRRRRVKLNLA